ncbi:MAG: hypothetical protein ABF958_14145 [Lentilactobacillus hilgardii]
MDGNAYPQVSEFTNPDVSPNGLIVYRFPKFFSSTSPLAMAVS